MGSRDRRAGHDRVTGVRPSDRYGVKTGSNEALFAPTRPVAPAQTPREVGRPELAQLLGRSVLEARVQRICQEYALLPRTGTAGSGLSRAYSAAGAGVEIAADAHGTVTTIVLRFDGKDGFVAYQGPLPAGAGSIPRRSRVWAMLGRPDRTGIGYRDRHLTTAGPWDRWQLPEFTMDAQYAADAEQLERLTLSLPAHLPRAA